MLCSPLWFNLFFLRCNLLDNMSQPINEAPLPSTFRGMNHYHDNAFTITYFNGKQRLLLQWFHCKLECNPHRSSSLVWASPPSLSAALTALQSSRCFSLTEFLLWLPLLISGPYSRLNFCSLALDLCAMEGLLLSIFKYLNYEEADTLTQSFIVESQFL